MTHRSWLEAMALSVTLSGCSGVEVRTQYDPTAEYPRYRSYAWLATAPGVEQAAAVRDPAVRALVIGAVDRELARKGLARTTPDAGPDFLVSVVGLSRDRVEVREYGYAPSYLVGPGWAAPVAEVARYTEGTLLLDFVDAGTRRLFWRGTAAGALDATTDLQRTVDDAVRRMLEAFPPRAGP